MGAEFTAVGCSNLGQLKPMILITSTSSKRCDYSFCGAMTSNGKNTKNGLICSLPLVSRNGKALLVFALMVLGKYHLSLAGEYRVASELLKRDIFATITFGNAKGADLYAIGPTRRTAIIEVKSSNSSKFVTGFYQKYRDEIRDHPDFWVLYSMMDPETEEFYVLSHTEMARAQGARNFPGKKMTYAEHAIGVAKGVDNVVAKDLQKYKSAWSKIGKYLRVPPQD
jgi:hypothetical protein